MGKVRSVAVALALAVGLALSVGTAPAQAESIRYVYYLHPDCINGGNLGIEWGWWTSYSCVHMNFGPNGPDRALWA